MWYIESVLWRKPDKILKNVFTPFKGSQNKVFPIKKLAFEIFIFILSQICNFCQNFKKSCFIIFIDVWPYQCYTVIFSLRITLNALLSKVPSIRILLSIGSFNGKYRLSEGHPIVLSNFPFVNLQIKSISESLHPITSCTQ